jgi:hypothetical protein
MGAKIKVADIEICSAELKSGHPELFHYTSRAGLEAIVRSNTCGQPTFDI